MKIVSLTRPPVYDSQHLISLYLDLTIKSDSVKPIIAFEDL